MRGFAPIPSIDMDAAETLFSPSGTGEGNWVGAPSVHRHDGRTYLGVRRRNPEARGYAVTVYDLTDGTPDECREITAAELGVVSVERPAMVTDPATGRLRLYLPVDHGGNDWTIQTFAPFDSFDDLDVETAHDVLRPRANTTDASTVKDPYVLTVGGRYYMFYAGHDGHSEQAHLATSVDGEVWNRSQETPVLPRQYWHDYHTRVSCVVPARDAPVWYVFYEGSGANDYGKVWNLRTGLAISHDLERIRDTTPRGPLFAAQTADRSTGVDDFATFRYLDVLDDGDAWEVFFEAANPDGTFSLRRAEMVIDV